MIVVVDYGMGNLASIVKMIKKVGGTAALSTGPDDIARATKLILPGVGSFDHGMAHLHQRGYVDLLTRRVVQDKVPILGICLGMQLLTCGSEEGQPVPGLGWIDAQTIRFRFEPPAAQLKIPHMGWNTVKIARPHPLFPDPEAHRRFYFVHSYHVVCRDPANVLTSTTYGFEFTSAVVKDNIIGTQFHPEKSLHYGMDVMKHFVQDVPTP
jgi:glutamine amidotransferase